MSPECRKRFQVFIYEALMVREFKVIDMHVASERAANIAMGIEADFNLTLREEPWTDGGNESNEGSPSPGSGQSGPASTAGRSTATRTGEGNGRGAGTAAKNTADHLALGTDNWRFRGPVPQTEDEWNDERIK